jgi:signal transduction histidine kinase
MEQHRSKQSPVRQYRIDGEEETWLDVYDVATPDGGSLVMYLDVTVSQHQEERLRQSQKMEAVGQLTGGVAHDFNNLLAVVMGNAELLARWAVDASEKHRRAIDAIVRASQRGAELTQRLLAFSRKQMLDPEIIDLGTRLPDINAMLRRTLGETIDLKNVLAGNLWRCLVDPGQLENASLNLAINARDAMPRGGRLTIETSNTVLDRDYVAAHSDLEPGEYVMVAVSDSGVGMSADTVEHAFDPFFTTKEIGKGTGLGLSMVFGFAKQSGGHVTIYSEPDVGTTVKLYLPRSIEASEEQKEEPSTLPPPTREEIVLVVEDDADARALTVTLVGSLGYEVLETANGPAALELLEQQPTVDILLTDVVLPHGLSGPEIAQRARKIVPGLKVLFMSGYAESAITHRGELEEGLVFLQKPFGLDDLANKLRTVLDGES